MTALLPPAFRAGAWACCHCCIKARALQRAWHNAHPIARLRRSPIEQASSKEAARSIPV